MEETKLDVDQHVKILKELREACFKYFGEKTVVSVITTKALAEACAKSHEYWSVFLWPLSISQRLPRFRMHSSVFPGSDEELQVRINPLLRIGVSALGYCVCQGH